MRGEEPRPEDVRWDTLSPLSGRPLLRVKGESFLEALFAGRTYKECGLVMQRLFFGYLGCEKRVGHKGHCHNQFISKGKGKK